MSGPSLNSSLSSFLTLLATTPEASLPSLLPSLGQLRAALLATVEGEGEEQVSPVKEEQGRKEEDSGIESPGVSPEKEVKVEVKLEVGEDMKTGRPGSEDMKTGSPVKDIKTGSPGEDVKTGSVSPGVGVPSLGGGGERKRGERKGGKVTSARSSDPRCVMFR